MSSRNDRSDASTTKPQAVEEAPSRAESSVSSFAPSPLQKTYQTTDGRSLSFVPMDSEQSKQFERSLLLSRYGATTDDSASLAKHSQVESVDPPKGPKTAADVWKMYVSEELRRQADEEAKGQERFLRKDLERFADAGEDNRDSKERKEMKAHRDEPFIG